MICPKCGNDMGNSMYCNNCNLYPFKDKEPFQWKKTLKITGITIGCFIAFFIIVFGFIEISDKQTYNEKINAQYDEIYQEYLDKDYYSALRDIEYFRSSYDDKKMLSKISDLSDEIELYLYNDIKSADIAISECNTYLEFFPNGKYINEVNDLLPIFTEKQAIQDINKATIAIQQNDILEAESLLQSVIDNTNVSENTKKQAQEVLNPIANKVYTEKGKKAILGSWRKETGVVYTFEEDGHMSVSLSSNYNNSLGTTWDGMEVNSLLSEINDFSRVVRGGTWKYVGTDTNGSETVYAYSLFYYGSQYSCIILVDNNRKMGIYLSSGIGDMSILTK